MTGEQLEFERTFLVRRLPELSGVRSKRIVDIYFPEELSVHPRLRLRRTGDRFELTKKTPSSTLDASEHVEVTIQLDAREYEALSSSSARSLEKVRYYLQVGGRPAELDVFAGRLKGLALIDFEFSGRDEMESFVPPEICLADVTQETFIAGGILAGRSLVDISADLSRFDYAPV